MNLFSRTQSLEFVLSAQDAAAEDVRKALEGLGQGLEIFLLPRCDTERSLNFKIHIVTEDPTLIFDTCAQFGRIKSVKIN